MFHFLLVWYYCTLVIRESILRHNGSRFVETHTGKLREEWGHGLSVSLQLRQVISYYDQSLFILAACMVSVALVLAFVPLQNVHIEFKIFHQCPLQKKK